MRVTGNRAIPSPSPAVTVPIEMVGLSGFAFVTVTVPVPRATEAPVTAPAATEKVRVGWAKRSAATVTAMDFAVSPGANVTTPLAGW